MTTQMMGYNGAAAARRLPSVPLQGLPAGPQPPRRRPPRRRSPRAQPGVQPRVCSRASSSPSADSRSLGWQVSKFETPFFIWDCARRTFCPDGQHRRQCSRLMLWSADDRSFVRTPRHKSQKSPHSVAETAASRSRQRGSTLTTRATRVAIRPRSSSPPPLCICVGGKSDV